MAKWSFYDPTDDTTYVFPVNPNEGGTPGRTKKLEYQATAAPDGVTLIFEGRDEARQIQVSGVLLDQGQLEALDAWVNDRRHQIRLTDDLGRQFWIYLTNFEATRNRRQSHPWHHSYRLGYVILDNP
jgi:hypothetical protein